MDFFDSELDSSQDVSSVHSVASDGKWNYKMVSASSNAENSAALQPGIVVSCNHIQFSYEDQSFVSRDTIFDLLGVKDCKRCTTNCLKEISSEACREITDYSVSIDFIQKIRSSYVALSKEERVKHLTELLMKDASYSEKTGKNLVRTYHLRHLYDNVDECKKVCSVCFDHVYGISKDQRKRLLKKIKRNENQCPPFNDKSSVSDATLEDMKNTAKKNSIFLSREEIASIQMARTHEVLRVS